MSWKGSWRVCLSCTVFAVAWLAMESRSKAHFLAGDGCHCASCAEGLTDCAVCSHAASKRMVARSYHRHDGSFNRHGGRKYGGGARIRREGLSQRQRSGGIR
jgi:hypothetical protein